MGDVLELFKLIDSYELQNKQQLGDLRVQRDNQITGPNIEENIIDIIDIEFWNELILSINEYRKDIYNKTRLGKNYKINLTKNLIGSRLRIQILGIDFNHIEKIIFFIEAESQNQNVINNNIEFLCEFMKYIFNFNNIFPESTYTIKRNYGDTNHIITLHPINNTIIDMWSLLNYFTNKNNFLKYKQKILGNKDNENTDTNYKNYIEYLKNMQYLEYLKTDHWQHFRKEAFKFYKSSCQICNSKNNLNIHHKTYKNRGRETFNDIVILCYNCHELFHDKIIDRCNLMNL